MHCTLKAETSRPPARSVAEQQERFDRFRRYYNEDRPHEAIGQKAPAQLWPPPARTLPAGRLEDPWYDADHEVRRVRPDGEIKWQGEPILVGEAFAPRGRMVGHIGRRLLDHTSRRKLRSDS
jgi:hypothetical protein